MAKMKNGLLKVSMMLALGLVGGNFASAQTADDTDVRTQYTACDGVYNGTWAYKEGRPMTLVVRSGYGNQVQVTVIQQNGREVTRGVCRERRDGSAQLSFQGRFNFGRVSVSPYGDAYGMVSNFGFSGQRR